MGFFEGRDDHFYLINPVVPDVVALMIAYTPQGVQMVYRNFYGSSRVHVFMVH